MSANVCAVRTDAGVQLGTRFLATPEARVPEEYKQAIVAARAADIVWTNKLAGTNSSVIRTAQVEEGGLRVHPIVGWLLRNSYTKNLTRMLMLTRAMETYKKAAYDGRCEIWQAGKGVEHISAVESCDDILKRFASVAGVART